MRLSFSSTSCSGGSLGGKGRNWLLHSLLHVSTSTLPSVLSQALQISRGAGRGGKEASDGAGKQSLGSIPLRGPPACPHCQGSLRDSPSLPPSLSIPPELPLPWTIHSLLLGNHSLPQALLLSQLLCWGLFPLQVAL